jgi:Rod binding domain-containing protein
MTIEGLNPGLTTLAQRQEGASVSSQSESPAHKKLRKAAQEFEGMLISQLLSEFKMGVSSVSGESPLAGSETLNSLAVQTLSSAMAGRGGFGLGKMLVKQLEPGLNRGHANVEGGKIKTASRG